MTKFESIWNRFHPGLRPVGHLLRTRGGKNWLRFHSLPESKRYAETPEERRVLLDRQNTLARQVLGTGPCWLVQAHWLAPAGDAAGPGQLESIRVTAELSLSFAFDFLGDEHEDDLRRIHAGETRWETGGFDDLLLTIADWEAAPTLWFSASDGAVFAPYDGGVDLFLPEAVTVRRLAAEHADWLSAHPEGL